MSEAEFYALVHGACHGLGMQSYLKDLGIDMSVEIESDSSSAKSYSYGGSYSYGHADSMTLDPTSENRRFDFQYFTNSETFS